MIAAQRRTIAFAIALGTVLVGVAVALNVSWIVLNWREGILVFLGAILFSFIIAGMVLNTIFLVRELRRNEQHDAFINAVTHELKTPVASLRLYLETLQSRPVEEAKRQEFYRIMLADTDRLLHTIEQVLQAGRSGRVRRSIVRAPVDLAVLAQECCELTRQRRHLPPEAIRCEAAAGTMVLGDSEELRAALVNLIDNAVKYSGPEIRVSVGLRAIVGNKVALAVEDRGAGIPPGELKRIFRRFYRVSGRGGAGVMGTGLGLFIVRSIARRHGGRVYAESGGLGQGSRFTLELPAHETQ